ncbi:MAG: 6,7-dimethyl-8-ribityllumazine synthase [Planctomycetota bacterium]|jgi:6,7-dimethyl-8-ribityllumazine synthase|nr:6,7-dimethyl-8-ribityllumazine synthase [Planctomycetota bacterium]MDG2142751.1 6,7-dimethyl-8-ribityllumazine synthase [Planctomycetota bacterium]
MALDESQSTSAVLLRPGVRIGVVVSRYHGELTGAMLRAARTELESAGLAPKDLVVLDAPGAFELPLIAKELARREDIDAVIVFGLVLKGETEHDRHISRAVAHACMDIGFETGTPALFGVLTCNTLDQARARALSVEEGGEQNKGREVARACLEVLHGLDLARNLPTSGTRFSRIGDVESVTQIDSTNDQDDVS